MFPDQLSSFMSRDSSVRSRITSLNVQGSTIVVGREALVRAAQPLLDACRNRQVAVITATPVRRRYGGVVLPLLREAGITPLLITVPDGETTKSLKWASYLYDRLVAARFERGAILIALGGGVVGDLTGFVASTYLRGVGFIQIPTTLVAQVDASIGGKTGVDHPRGKNLIGTFYQPKLVFIDVSTLRTLPRREVTGGMAEVVKYGVIADPDLLSYVEQHADDALGMNLDVLEHIVLRSASIKADVVNQDEREAGIRRILNYGHTLGHAIEAATRYGRYHHGEAVAIGMQFAAYLAVRLGTCHDEVARRQGQLLKRLKLRTMLPPRVSVRSLFSAMALDKKVSGGQINYVLPERIGRVVVKPVEFDLINETLKDFARGREGRVP
jgi:3-dehydroquinate synthase